MAFLTARQCIHINLEGCALGTLTKVSTVALKTQQHVVKFCGQLTGAHCLAVTCLLWCCRWFSSIHTRGGTRWAWIWTMFPSGTISWTSNIWASTCAVWGAPAGVCCAKTQFLRKTCCTCRKCKFLQEGTWFGNLKLLGSMLMNHPAVPAIKRQNWTIWLPGSTSGGSYEVADVWPPLWSALGSAAFTVVIMTMRCCHWQSLSILPCLTTSRNSTTTWCNTATHTVPKWIVFDGTSTLGFRTCCNTTCLWIYFKILLVTAVWIVIVLLCHMTDVHTMVYLHYGSNIAWNIRWLDLCTFFAGNIFPGIMKRLAMLHLCHWCLVLQQVILSVLSPSIQEGQSAFQLEIPVHTQMLW